MGYREKYKGEGGKRWSCWMGKDMKVKGEEVEWQVEYGQERGVVEE